MGRDYLRRLVFFPACAFILVSVGYAKKESALPPAGAFSPKAQKNVPEQTKEELADLIKRARNPFLTDEEEEEFDDSVKAIPIDYLRLTAILYSPPNKSKAIIDGRILEIGSYIDNKETVEIQPEAVILKDAQAEYIIKLKNISGR